MRRSSFEVVKCIVVLAMLMPAVTLAQNSYGEYSYATVTPTTVAPGGTITVEFGYTVTIDQGSYQIDPHSLWEIRLDAGSARATSDSTSIPPLKYGKPVYGTYGTHTFYVNEDVTIPAGTQDGQHTIEIFSCAWFQQPVSAYLWYVVPDPLPGNGYPITITVASDPAVLVDNLIGDVQAINAEHEIPNSSLEAKLQAASKVLDDLNTNNDVAAVNTLGVFIDAVEAQRDILGDVDTNDLIDAATIIIGLLSPA